MCGALRGNGADADVWLYLFVMAGSGEVMEIYRLLSAPEPWKSFALVSLKEAHAEPNRFHAH